MFTVLVLRTHERAGFHIEGIYIYMDGVSYSLFVTRLRYIFISGVHELKEVCAQSNYLRTVGCTLINVGIASLTYIKFINLSSS